MAKGEGERKKEILRVCTKETEMIDNVSIMLTGQRILTGILKMTVFCRARKSLVRKAR